ncbi:MAG: ABC transporter permease [Euryarchaeota archaeon]|nr:ABC transporter permease [Euryarchaeota archaeon]
MTSVTTELKVSAFLAYKSIAKGNKGTSVLTILIMALAFVNLMFMSSLFAGLTDASEDQVIETLYSNIVIEPKDEETYIKYPDSILKKVNSVPGVLGTSAQYLTASTITHEEKSGAWTVRSVDPNNEITVSAVPEMMIAGEYLSKYDRDEIVIGKEIAGGHGGSLEHLSLGGVVVGDTVEVAFKNGVRREYRIKGIFDTNFIQSNQLAYITEKEMESVLGTTDMTSQILVKTERKGGEAIYVEQFTVLGVHEDIKTWAVYAGIVATITQSFTAINTLISTIGLFVAGITIFIVIYVSTVSKRRQMGILRAIGIKESIIIRSYVFQAVFYAICGCIAGLMVMFMVLVPYYIKHPLVFPMGDVTLVIEQKNAIARGVALIAAALIAGFIPSWRAVRETILDAIWGD